MKPNFKNIDIYAGFQPQNGNGVAKENGNDPMEKNFERAAELVDVPDDVILKMYDKLRPNRSTKLELVLMAQELLEKYNAKTYFQF